MIRPRKRLSFTKKSILLLRKNTRLGLIKKKDLENEKNDIEILRIITLPIGFSKHPERIIDILRFIVIMS